MGISLASEAARLGAAAAAEVLGEAKARSRFRVSGFGGFRNPFCVERGTGVVPSGLWKFVQLVQLVLRTRATRGCLRFPVHRQQSGRRTSLASYLCADWLN